MAVGVALLILIGAIVGGYKASIGKTRRKKLINWGLVTMFGIAPFFSWLVGISFGVYVGDGFTGGALMVMLFGAFFLIGLIMLLVGIFGKDTKTV